MNVEEGSFRAYGPQQQMWHSIAAVAVRVQSRRGVQRFVVVSAHLNPFSIDQQLLDLSQVHRAVHRNFVGPDLPGFIGADFNSSGASVLPDGSFCDQDGYDGKGWRPIYAIQLGPDGRVDRRTAQQLEHKYRLQDLAVLAGAEWKATTGHDPADQHPARRLDRLYATPGVPAGAVEELTVIRSPAALEASDHLPTPARIDTDRLSPPTP